MAWSVLIRDSLYCPVAVGFKCRLYYNDVDTRQVLITKEHFDSLAHI